MKRCSSFGEVFELSFYLLIAFCAIWKIIPTLDERGFWSDELFTAAVVRYHPVMDSQFERKTVMQIKMDDSFLTVKAGEQHPPMYDISLKGWASLFGDSETSLRGFNVFVIALASIIIFLSCWRRKAYPLGILIAVTTLVMLWHPVTQSYATQARSYIFFLMLSLLCLLAFYKIKVADSNEFMWRFTFYALATISFLTHYYMAVFIGAVYIFVAYGDLRERRYVLPLIPVPFVFSWIFLSYHSLLFTASGGVAWSKISYLQALQSMLHIIYGYFGLSSILILFSVIYFLFKRKTSEIQVAICIAVSISVLAFVCKKSGILHPRHFIFIIPWCVYLILNGTLSLFNNKFTLLVVASLIVFISPSTGSQANVYANEQYKEAAKLISEKYSGKGYKIYATWSPNEAYYRYYLENYASDHVSINMLSSISDVNKICSYVNNSNVVLYAHHSHNDVIKAFESCLPTYDRKNFDGIVVIAKP
ncbi:glycosyltransferase family 39 protein [Aeromonas media]|uniref:glycosyltransferase family 39 protein n=1 Tax=Aeromonas media TaxID=651 RepID=UPI00227F2B4C|nr:glycosyltransferase family 39 protein [Aeromonas media]MCY9821483.1 glycosyltransferase family 39 protein [Aeromonas media]